MSYSPWICDLNEKPKGMERWKSYRHHRRHRGTAKRWWLRCLEVRGPGFAFGENGLLTYSDVYTGIKGIRKYPNELYTGE